MNNFDESDLTTDEESSSEDVGYVVADYDSEEDAASSLATENNRVPLNSDANQSDGGITGQQFDPVLASRHLYLGTNWEELQGRTILDENATYEIPLLPGTVVAVPGHTIPLTFFHESRVAMFRRVIQGNRLFGLISGNGSDGREESSIFGTIAEIFEYSDDVDTGHGLKIKAKGRQRFQLLEQRLQIDGNVMGKVWILPDKNFPDSLYECRLTSLDHYRNSAAGKKQLYKQQYKVPLSAWPAWVHAQYDAQILADRIIATVQLNDSKIKLPTAPEELSYWLTQNLPLDDKHRLLLLKKDSTVQRLRCALGLLEHCKMLCCKECDHIIARQDDTFCMTQEGSQTTFVNPSGFVHDTLTLTRAKGVRIVTRPSTQFSWFPGYAWSCAECARCRNHLGWLFTAVTDSLRPLKFWGLTRRSLKPCFQMEEGNPDVKIVM